MSDANREGFEAWVVQRGFTTEQTNGFYDEPRVHDWWSAWNASRAAPAEDVRAVVDEPVAEIVSKFGDPEAFGERELVARMDIQSLPYDTKLCRHAQRKVVMPERLREVWLFLDGQAELNGCVFGEKPEGRHNFWWRKELRAVLEDIYPQ